MGAKLSLFSHEAPLSGTSNNMSTKDEPSPVADATTSGASAGNDADVKGVVSGNANVALTKNARKRLARAAYREQKKITRKAERRALKLEKQIAKREARAAELAEMSPTERAKATAARENAVRKLREDDRARRTRVRDALAAAATAAVEEVRNGGFQAIVQEKDTAEKEKNLLVKVCVDVGWEGVMGEKEERSLARQLAYSYSAVRKAVERGERPLALSVAGLGESVRRAMHFTASGWEMWPFPVVEDALTKLHPARNVVYLTHDAEDVLEQLEPNDIYVIGGLVDRNRLKGATLQRAKELEVRAKRLSLDEEVSLAHGTPVLTVNHCVEIMLHAANGKSWRDAYIAVLPVRKGLDFTTKALSNSETKPKMLDAGSQPVLHDGNTQPNLLEGNTKSSLLDDGND